RQAPARLLVCDQGRQRLDQLGIRRARHPELPLLQEKAIFPRGESAHRLYRGNRGQRVHPSPLQVSLVPFNEERTGHPAISAGERPNRKQKEARVGDQERSRFVLGSENVLLKILIVVGAPSTLVAQRAF